MFRAILAVAGTMTIAVGLGMSGTAVAEHKNPDQHFNFECSNCTKNTTVDKGKTNLILTCYGRQAALESPDTFSALCKSPEVGITCKWSEKVSACHCSSDAPKAHTVHVTINECEKVPDNATLH